MNGVTARRWWNASACAFGLGLAMALAASPAFAASVEVARPGERPPAGSDEDELWYAMDRAERELREHPLLERDEALNAYVRGVACRVAGDYCPDLRVYIVRQPWFNASMAPNGALVVWTGALLRCRDEAELAMVLAHEVAHFRQRHSLQRWREMKKTSALTSSIGLLAWGGGAGAASQLASLLGVASERSFSRDAEREADRIGFAIATAEGYDASAGPRIWQRLLREEQARTNGKAVPVFATHPKTAERLEDVTAAAANVPEGGETGATAYRAATHPFHDAWLGGELSRRLYDTSIRVIDDLRAHVGPDLQATYAFHLGEAYRRRGAAGDAALAAEWHARALSLPDPPAAAWREHGLARRDAGDAAGAIAALTRYLQLAPEAEDAAFVRQYLAELGASP